MFNWPYGLYRPYVEFARLGPFALLLNRKRRMPYWHGSCTQKSDRWTVCIQIHDAAVNPAKLLPLFKQSRGLRAANVCTIANTNCIENRKSILINVRLKRCYISTVYYENSSVPLLIGADEYTGWSTQMTAQILHFSLKTRTKGLMYLFITLKGTSSIVFANIHMRFTFTEV